MPQAVVCGSGRRPCPIRGGLTLSDIAGWLADKGLLDVFGVVGVIGYIGAYLSLQLGLIRGNGYLFPAVNLAASMAVLISLTRDFNPYSVTIEIALAEWYPARSSACRWRTPRVCAMVMPPELGTGWVMN